MGHVIDYIATSPAPAAKLTAEQTAFLAAVSDLKNAFYRGRKFVLREEFVFVDESLYEWAASRLLAIVSEMRFRASESPESYFMPEVSFMEKENGDEYDSMTVVLPSHDAELPHRVHIRNKVYPF